MLKCLKHPKYKGKRKPTNQCEDCLKLYLHVGSKPRQASLPKNKVIPDKSKYSRKSKHKSSSEE